MGKCIIQAHKSIAVVLEILYEVLQATPYSESNHLFFSSYKDQEFLELKYLPALSTNTYYKSIILLTNLFLQDSLQNMNIFLSYPEAFILNHLKHSSLICLQCQAQAQEIDTQVFKSCRLPVKENLLQIPLW